MMNYFSYVIRTVVDQRRALQIVSGLFLIGLVVGTGGSEAVSNYIQMVFQNLVGQFKGLQGFDLFLRIFLHNLMAATMATASGILLGILPLVSAFLNGLVIGTVLTDLSAYSNLSVFGALMSILPHGIFEIPAFLLALALGWTLGRWPFKREKSAYVVATFNACSGTFFKIIIPFLGVAAAIETLGIELLR
jgi:uncharacterized membrane protein SpoIIM required for sporulation